MSKPFAENKFFVAMLVTSALLNVGLAYKVSLQQRTLQVDRHANVIGIGVDHLNVAALDGTAATISFSKSDLPTILYVFRPGCGWCAQNMPNLQAMAVLAPARHFRLIGLSLDDQNLKKYVDSQHFTFPVFSDVAPNERVRLELGGTPQTLLIANGMIVQNWEGAYTPELQKEIESKLGIKLPGLSATPPTHL